MVLRGPRVTLRRADLDDAERLTSIRREPEIERRWGILEEGEMEEFVRDDKTFVVDVDGEVVGAVQYGEVEDPMYRSASIDLYLTTPRHGQGLGSEAVRILARYLIEELGHHRLTIDPAADNAPRSAPTRRSASVGSGSCAPTSKGPTGRSTTVSSWRCSRTSSSLETRHLRDVPAWS